MPGLSRLSCHFLTGFLVLVGHTLPTLAHSLEDLEENLKDKEKYAQIVNRPAPEFRFNGPVSEAVSLVDFRGKVVILWFIYTRCPDVCPLHSEALASIQEQVNRTPMRELVRFITVTTDPANDSPEAMKAYGPAHGLDPVNWVFLTSGRSRPAATREIAWRYGLKFTRVEDMLRTADTD